MSWKKKSLFLGVMLVVVLGVAEGGYRIWLWGQGESYSVTATEEEMAGIVESMGEALKIPGARKREHARRNVHPFYAFETEGFFEPVRDALASPEADRTYDVLVVGGSVAQVLADSMAAPIARALGADPRLAGRTIRVLNHAHPGFKQPQQTLVVSYLLSLGLRPDAVINLDGLNEVALGNLNRERGAHPLHPALNMWAPVVRGTGVDREIWRRGVHAHRLREEGEAIAGSATRWRMTWSALLGRFTLARLHRVKAGWVEAAESLANDPEDPFRRDLLGPGFEGTEEQAIEVAARSWVEGSRSLHALLAPRGIAYLHVLQPTLHDPGSKPLSEEERRTGSARPAWVAGVEQGYPRLRRFGAALSEEGVPFHDASGSLSGIADTLYVDSCHLNPEGNEILARTVARAFLDSLP